MEPEAYVGTMMTIVSESGIGAEDVYKHIWTSEELKQYIGDRKIVSYFDSSDKTRDILIRDGGCVYGSENYDSEFDVDLLTDLFVECYETYEDDEYKSFTYVTDEGEMIFVMVEFDNRK